MADLWTPEDPKAPQIWTPRSESDIPEALEQVYDYVKSTKNVYHFLEKHVYISDATTEQIIKYQFWNHLKFFVWALNKYRKVIVLKAKQLGISFTLAAIALHRCYNTAANVLEISAGQLEAADLLKKSKDIRRYLPKHLQQEYSHDGTELQAFKTPNSRIRAFPSTKDAGLGQTASWVILDENEFHDYAESNYGNITPTVDAGAPLTIVSTIDGTRTDTHFRKLWYQAVAGLNGFYPIFFGVFCRPGRDEAWYQRAAKSVVQKWQVLKNYPRTAEEALSPITGKGVFDAGMLVKMIEKCTDPEELRQGVIYIYNRAKMGVQYMAGLDMGEGVDEARSVLWIEGKEGLQRELCAIIVSSNIHADTFAFMSKVLLDEYYQPRVIGGADGWGARALEDLVSLNYPREKIYSSSDKKLGYQESPKTQEHDILELEAAVREGLKIGHKPALQEMLALQYKSDKGKTRIDTALGARKDMVMAAVKANFGFKTFKQGEPIKIQSYY